MNSTVLHGNSALGGIADTSNVRAQQARADSLARSISWARGSPPRTQSSDVSVWCSAVSAAAFRDQKTLDTIDRKFNTSIHRALVYELATGRFIEQYQDRLDFEEIPAAAPATSPKGSAWRLSTPAFLLTTARRTSLLGIRSRRIDRRTNRSHRNVH